MQQTLTHRGEDTDNGSVGNLSRRQFFLAAGGVAGLCMALGLFNAVEPEVAEALTTPVTFTKGRRVNYDRFFTNECRVNGYLGFCVNPVNYMPPSGSYGNVWTDCVAGSEAAGTVDEGPVRWQLRKVMYNGLEGPAYSDAFFPATWFDGSAMDWDKRYACQHILLADLYALNLQYATYGCTRAFKNWVERQVSGISQGADGKWNVLNAGSMRAHITTGQPAGDSARFPDAPDGFNVYVMVAGYDSAHGRDYQRIMFSEPNGMAKLTKSANNVGWL